MKQAITSISIASLSPTTIAPLVFIEVTSTLASTASKKRDRSLKTISIIVINKFLIIVALAIRRS